MDRDSFWIGIHSTGGLVILLSSKLVQCCIGSSKRGDCLVCPFDRLDFANAWHF